MGFRPGDRLLFGAEKTIDDNGIALSHSPSARARSFAMDHTRSAVHSHARRIRKDDFAAIGNFLWIDGAISFAQTCSVPACLPARTFAMPVNRHACQLGILSGERLPGQKQ